MRQWVLTVRSTGRSPATRARAGYLKRYTYGGTMQRTWLLILGSSVIALVSGCATTMSARASHVHVITANAAAPCQFVSNVSASSSLSGVARYTGYQNALNSLLDKVAAEGANSVVLDSRSGPAYWTTSEVVRGTAYKCSQ